MGRVPEGGWGAKGQETLDYYTAQENVFIALKHGVFLMTVIRKFSLMTDLGLTLKTTQHQRKSFLNRAFFAESRRFGCNKESVLKGTTTKLHPKQRRISDKKPRDFLFRLPMGPEGAGTG
jgi:hypothetical protein